MSAETLEINLFARPDGEHALSWLVAVSVNEQAIPGPTTLRHPFNEEQRSDCRWYVEEFVCKSPYSVTRARHTATTLWQYSKSLLFQLGLVKLLKDNFASHCRGNRSITISISEDEGPEQSVHQLHWELLEDPSFWDTEVQVTVKRIVISKEKGKRAVIHDVALDGEPKFSALPRVNGLLVVARDLSPDSKRYDDVSPHLALGILARIQDDLPSLSKSQSCLHLEVVRPGSLEALEKHLKRATEIHGKNYYHFAHFDVHGVVKSNERTGYLLFNKPGPDDLHDTSTVQLENAKTVAELLGQYGVTVAVLNACESARANCGDAANIAKTFSRSGVQNVLAMSFRISSSAVELVLRAFYHSLFLEGKSFSHAARRAREVLRDHPERQARLGLKRPLVDYFVPVVYSCGQDSRLPLVTTKSISRGLQSDTSDFALRTAQLAGKGEKQQALIGREFDLLRLEKKLVAQGRVHLTGRAGVGKSALLRHASGIWQQTSFVDIVLFVDFTKVRSLEDAVGSFVSQIPLSMLERLTLQSKLKAMITSPTFDSAMFAGVLLGACSRPRLMIIFDGLHVFYPINYSWKPERPSEGAVPMLRRFIEALLNLGDADTPHDAIYHILVSRLDSATFPFSQGIQKFLSSEKSVFRLPSLRLSDSVELSQLALRDAGLNINNWLDADLNELELLVGLLDGNPSAILHVLPQMSQTGIQSSHEFRGLVQHDILPKSYAGHASEAMLKEIDSLFHALRDEPRDFLLLLSTVWHEGIDLICLMDWTNSHKICTKAQSALVFADVLGRGLIEVGPGKSSVGGVEESGAPVTWIHPLLTICGRQIANEILRGRQSQSAAAALVLSTLGVQFDETMLSEQTQILCANFKTWFLLSVATFDVSRAVGTALRGFSYPDLYATWSLAAGNLATCLSICTRQPYLPVDQWPLAYFQSNVAFIRIVGSPAQVADYAKSFEQLLKNFIKLNGDSHAIPPLRQRYALLTVTCLTSIYAVEVPDPTKHEKYVQMGLRIVKESEERFGKFEDPDVRDLKGQTLRQHAGYLIEFGPREQAVEVWKTMLDYEKSIFENPHSFRLQWSQEQIQAFANENSNDEADAEATAKILSARSVNSMQEITYKLRKNSLNFVSAMVSYIKGEDARPTRKFQAILARQGHRMEQASEGAEAMGIRGMNQYERGWPEGHDLHHTLYRIDNDLEWSLAGLEIAQSTGDAAEASQHAGVLLISAFKNLEVNEVEEYYNVLMRYSEHLPLREGHSFDWAKGKETITWFTTTMNILLGNSTKATDGMRDHELVAELTEKQISQLKESNAPRETIEALEIWLETWLNVPHPLPKTDEIDRGQAAEFLGSWQKSVRIYFDKIRGDKEFMQKFPKLQLQFQQHVQRLQEADLKKDPKLALERLEVLEEFLRQPDNEFFDGQFGKDWSSELRVLYQFMHAALTVGEQVTDAVVRVVCDEAHRLLNTFEDDLTSELRQWITDEMALTEEAPGPGPEVIDAVIQLAFDEAHRLLKTVEDGLTSELRQWIAAGMASTEEAPGLPGGHS